MDGRNTQRHSTTRVRGHSAARKKRKQELLLLLAKLQAQQYLVFKRPSTNQLHFMKRKANYDKVQLVSVFKKV